MDPFVALATLTAGGDGIAPPAAADSVLRHAVAEPRAPARAAARTAGMRAGAFMASSLQSVIVRRGRLRPSLLARGTPIRSVVPTAGSRTPRAGRSAWRTWPGAARR